MKRILDHAMSPYLSTFLLDHSRSSKYLFPKLKRENFICLNYLIEFPVHFRFSPKTLFSEYVEKTTQANLRLFTDCSWDHATKAVKKRITNRYALSPKALVDSDEFTYGEFEKRLLQGCSKISYYYIRIFFFSDLWFLGLTPVK